MATVSDLNQQISDIEQALKDVQARIAQRQRSLDNVSDKYEANAAYRARLQAEIEQLRSTAAVQQQALDTTVIERDRAQQTAQQQVSPKADQQADRTDQAAANASMPPYDDDQNLNPGWQINPETGQPYYTGNAVQTSQASAVDPDTDPFEASRLQREQENDAGAPTETAVDVGEEDPFEARRLEIEQEQNREQLATEATAVEPGYGAGYSEAVTQNTQSFSANPDAENEAAAAAESGRLNAQRQDTLRARQNRSSQGDWRVRIHLAAGSNYLYNAPTGKVAGRDLPGPGILAPLTVTDGVIFPYTPTIETSYQAKYQTSDLVHSNYRGYFYQNSFVDTINIRGTFTAQDTKEAQYLLAVIHFFRSATKMFYGQDAEAGTPPPLVYLSGLGQYQFNKHPCVISNFQYSLPNDVDYIRADGFNNIGVNLENRQSRSSGPGQGGVLGFLANKLGVNGLFPGGMRQVPTQNAVKASVTNTTPTDSTYVPTKMEISVQLLPIQTRSQVSKQFSLQAFANGNLLKGGFW